MFVFVGVDHFKSTTDLTMWLLMLIIVWGICRSCLSTIASTLEQNCARVPNPLALRLLSVIHARDRVGSSLLD